MSTGSRNTANRAAETKPAPKPAPVAAPVAEPIGTPPPPTAEAAPPLDDRLLPGITVDEALAQRDAETQKEIELGLRPAADVPPAPTVAPAGKTIPKVFADPCPVNPQHTKTRIYNTKGSVRYCCCDDCGHTWKQSGPEAGQR